MANTICTVDVKNFPNGEGGSPDPSKAEFEAVAWGGVTIRLRDPDRVIRVPWEEWDSVVVAMDSVKRT